MPILDIQKRARELGRIRIGQVVAGTNRKGEAITRPEKLDLFRLTSHSKPLLEKVAELYGGTVTEWAPQGGGANAWEVVTDSQRLPIMVPPQPVSQWYEFWTAGGCKHRCDGHTNVLTDELCDPEDYAHKEAIQRPTTRLNVVLRDVEGIGVWRLETHGWNAAVELPDSAEFLARAGGYVNGWVSLEPRTSKAEVPDKQNGGTKIQTRHFHVPIIEIDVTPAQLMAGEGRVATPVLEGPVKQEPKQEAPAIEAPKGEVRIPTPEQIAGANLEQLHGMARYLGQHGMTAHPAHAAAVARIEQLTQTPDEDGAYEAEIVPPAPGEPDPDVVWNQILKAAAEVHSWGLDQLTADFKTSMGIIPAEASGSELAAYLHQLTTGEQVPA